MHEVPWGLVSRSLTIQKYTTLVPAYSISPCEKLIGKHRKVHLFDTIDIPDSRRLVENPLVVSVLASVVIVFVSQNMQYDALLLTKNYKCNLIVYTYPGVFNMTTGPVHWLGTSSESEGGG